MKIRLAAIEDASLISALITTLSKEFIAHEFTEGGADILLGSMDPASVRKYITSGYRYHIAEKGGKMIGAIAIKENSHLYHLFVSKECQRSGVGRALWEVAKSVSLAEGNPGLFTVNASLGAAGMYEKLGFIRTSEIVSTAGILYIPMKWELTTGLKRKP
jgi:ribosomal protein S18 acetylase RimI-like enzyme